MATSKIRIHNDLWRVETISADSTEMNGPDVIMLGKTDYTSLKIQIREGMPESVTMNTIVHELCHAYVLSHGVSIRDEETACEFFGAHGIEVAAASALVMSELYPDDDEIASISYDDDDDIDDFEILGGDITDDGK